MLYELARVGTTILPISTANHFGLKGEIITTSISCLEVYDVNQAVIDSQNHLTPGGAVTCSRFKLKYIYG